MEEDFYQKYFADILDSIQEYPDQPIYPDNVQQLFAITYGFLQNVSSDSYTLSPFTLELTFQVLDWMVDLHITDSTFMSSISYDDYPK